MKNFDNDRAKIETDYITFKFDWNYIRDKQIIHKGDKDYGMIFILNEEGIAVKMYGYELIKDNNVP